MEPLLINRSVMPLYVRATCSATLTKPASLSYTERCRKSGRARDLFLEIIDHSAPLNDKMYPFLQGLQYMLWGRPLIWLYTHSCKGQL